MKQAAAILIWSLLSLVGCTVEEALPTAVPVAQVSTNTTIPSATTTSTPDSTSTPTATPIPEPAQGLTGTAVTLDLSLTFPIEGYLLFYWDRETPVEEPAYYSIPVSEPQQDLYVAVSDNSPVGWQTFPILSNQLNWPDEYTSWPRVAVSPDKSQLAFTLHKKIDGDSYVVNIHVANFVTGTLTQITEDYNAEIYNINWLPDNRTVIYSLGKDVLSAFVDDLVGEQFTLTFPSNVAKLINSPDGQFITIVLQTGELFFYDLKKGELLPASIDSQLSPDTAIWSPDSSWFVVNLVSSAGLMAINVQTNEQLTLAEIENFSLPSWSPTAFLLAFVKGTREAANLYIWDPVSQETRLVTKLGSYLNSPIWSQEGRYLAVAFVKDEMVDFLAFDTETDEIDIITQFEGVKQFTILSWSPDAQWLLVFLAQEDKSCLYIINRESGDAYCAVDSTGMIDPFAVHWLPGKPFLPE